VLGWAAGLGSEQRGNRTRIEEKWFLIAFKIRKMGFTFFLTPRALSPLKKNLSSRGPRQGYEP
jgi:hypothetical protein